MNYDNILINPALIHSFSLCTIPVYGISVQVRSQSGNCVTLVGLREVGGRLEESGDKLTAQVLSGAEQDYFKRFRYSKRINEWLGGRIAAKTALLALRSSTPETVPGQLATISILPDENGRPVSKQVEEQSFSISHSKGYAVALASHTASCGIDLQAVSPKLQNLTNRFASQKELSLLEELTEDRDTRLTMLWSAKEALKKSILHDQPAIFSGIKLRNIGVHRDGYRFDCAVGSRSQQTVRIQCLSPYVLAVTEYLPEVTEA